MFTGGQKAIMTSLDCAQVYALQHGWLKNQMWGQYTGPGELDTEQDCLTTQSMTSCEGLPHNLGTSKVALLDTYDPSAQKLRRKGCCVFEVTLALRIILSILGQPGL